jgi:hypothetical protein
MKKFHKNVWHTVSSNTVIGVRVPHVLNVEHAVLTHIARPCLPMSNTVLYRYMRISIPHLVYCALSRTENQEVGRDGEGIQWMIKTVLVLYSGRHWQWRGVSFFQSGTSHNTVRFLEEEQDIISSSSSIILTYNTLQWSLLYVHTYTDPMYDPRGNT